MTVQMENVSVIQKSNGISYTVRHNRDRFFYPDEWNYFFSSLRYVRQRLTFDVLLNTGARINEAIHIKVRDIDFERKTIILRVTKVKSVMGQRTPRPRIIAISSQLAKRLRERIRTKGLKTDDYLGILTDRPANTCLKKTLKEIGIKDYYMFSIHNLRKTHGNWLKALGIDGAEICTRLGHDYNTFVSAYVSPDIFTPEDIRQMKIILGDLYESKRKV